MARYNTFKYGDGTLYGTSPANSNLLWTFIVDWDGDGVYSGVNEASRMVDLIVRRGRNRMLSAKGFEFFDAGIATAIMNNDDGRYTPFNPASPLYPNVTPGKLFQLAVKDGNTGTNYSVIQGVIDDVVPIQNVGSPQVRITLKDGLQWLMDNIVVIGYLEANARQAIVEYIIDEVGSSWAVSADGSSLMSVSTLDYWWTWKRSALADLQELATSWAANFFHGRDGTLYFYGRDFTYNRTKAVDQSVILRDISLTQPWEHIKNAAQVEYHEKTEFDVDDPPGTENVLWETLGSAGFIFFDIGETIIIDVTFKYQSYRVAGQNTRTVYVCYADDMITDITADCPLTYLTPVGGGTRISITNNSAHDGYLSSLEIDGDVVYAPFKGMRKAEDATSQAAYGARSINVGGHWLEDPTEAQEIADWILGELKAPTAGVTIQFENRPDYQFYLDLFDRVELTIAKYGIADYYRVGYIEHEWLSENGQAVKTIFKLEPYLQSGGKKEKMFVGCLLSTTAAQTVSNNTWTGVDFDQELFDPLGLHSGSNAYVTIQATGYYHIMGLWTWDTPASSGFVRLRLTVDDTIVSNVIHEIPNTGPITQQVEYTALLTIGQTVALEGLQFTGDSLNMLHTDAPYSPLLGLYRLED